MIDRIFSIIRGAVGTISASRISKNKGLDVSIIYILASIT